MLCSTALRTRETLAAILPALEGDLQISVEDALYAADLEQLLTRLHALPETLPSVLLIGHNPGLHELALNLATPDSDLGQLKINRRPQAWSRSRFQLPAGRNSSKANVDSSAGSRHESCARDQRVRAAPTTWSSR